MNTCSASCAEGSTAAFCSSGAWELVRANRGAAGIDRQTTADVEQYGITNLLGELAAKQLAMSDSAIHRRQA
jgi:hypothetical protein